MNYNSPNNALLSCGLYTITREGKNNNNIISRQVESSSQGAIAAPFPVQIEKVEELVYQQEDLIIQDIPF